MKDFQDLLRTFQELNKTATSKEQSTPLPTFKPAQQGPALIDIEAPPVQDSAALARFQAVEEEREYHEALIADREQGIKEIAKAVQEVNEIFMDLSNLVADQGTMIDNIESNVETASSHVETGVVELKKASDYQRRSRTKMCCLALILAIVVGIIVVVVLLSTKTI